MGFLSSHTVSQNALPTTPCPTERCASIQRSHLVTIWLAATFVCMVATVYKICTWLLRVSSGEDENDMLMHGYLELAQLPTVCESALERLCGTSQQSADACKLCTESWETSNMLADVGCGRGLNTKTLLGQWCLPITFTAAASNSTAAVASAAANSTPTDTWAEHLDQRNEMKHLWVVRVVRLFQVVSICVNVIIIGRCDPHRHTRKHTRARPPPGAGLWALGNSD